MRAGCGNRSPTPFCRPSPKPRAETSRIPDGDLGRRPVHRVVRKSGEEQLEGFASLLVEARVNEDRTRGIGPAGPDAFRMMPNSDSERLRLRAGFLQRNRELEQRGDSLSARESQVANGSIFTILRLKYRNITGRHCLQAPRYEYIPPHTAVWPRGDSTLYDIAEIKIGIVKLLNLRNQRCAACPIRVRQWDWRFVRVRER